MISIFPGKKAFLLEVVPWWKKVMIDISVSLFDFCLSRKKWINHFSLNDFHFSWKKSIYPWTSPMVKEAGDWYHLKSFWLLLVKREMDQPFLFLRIFHFHLGVWICLTAVVFGVSISPWLCGGKAFLLEGGQFLSLRGISSSPRHQ